MLGLKSEDLIKRYKIKRVDSEYVVMYCPISWTFAPAFYDWSRDIIYARDNDESTLLHEISHALEWKFSERSQVKLDAAYKKAFQTRKHVDDSLIRIKQEATANVFAILTSTGPIDRIIESLKSYNLSTRRALHLSQPILARRFMYMGININWHKAYKYVYDQTGEIPKGLFS